MAFEHSSLTNKVAFVTGASSGIGRATALAFGRAGAKVAVADVNEAGAQETARLIEADHGKALALRCNVADEKQVKAAINATVEEFGRLDAAFNNAGVEQQLGPVHEINLDLFDRVTEVNLRGVFVCMQAEVTAMLRTGGGTIVNTSSGAGVMGIAGQAAYCASKYAVVGLTKAAALDYADQGIRVNAVCPGNILTPMAQRFGADTEAGRAAMIATEPIGRIGDTGEIADAVLWLSSDASSFVLGHALVVDGGQTL